MSFEQNQLPGEPELSDEALSAFLETAIQDEHERQHLDEMKQKAQDQLDDFLASIDYTPLVMNTARYNEAFAKQIQSLLVMVSERLELPIEDIHDLIDDHEIKQTMQTFTLDMLTEMAYYEEGHFTIIIDDLIDFYTAEQLVSAETPEYQGLVENYSQHKQRMYAFWMSNHDYEANHPVLLALDALLPGPRIDPTSETMVPYFAEAIALVEESNRRNARIFEFHAKIHHILQLDDDTDPNREKRRAVAIMLGLASLSLSLARQTPAEREEELRERLREDDAPLTDHEISVIIHHINNEYPL